MASPKVFLRALCLVIYVGLAWFSVVAKPLEPCALSHRPCVNTSFPVGVPVDGMDIKCIHGVGSQPPAVAAVEAPTSVDQIHSASGCALDGAQSRAPTLTCSPPLRCSLDSGRTGAAYSCHGAAGAEAVSLDALYSASIDTLGRFGTNATPFPTPETHDAPPGPYEASPAEMVPSEPPHATDTATRLEIFTDPTLAPAQNRQTGEQTGEQTVYVTVTDESNTGFPTPTKAYSSSPLPGASAQGPPEPSGLGIILGSVFGTLAIVGILAVLTKHLCDLGRQKCEEAQEEQNSEDGLDAREPHQPQEQQKKAYTVGGMSELLRQQQQAYGYYGTQRVASHCIAPQMGVSTASPEPVELPIPEDKAVGKERRDGH